MAATSKTTTDHDEIRRWAEARGAVPSTVTRTRSKQDVGIIRLDFPGFSGEDSLEPIGWDEFFEKFDQQGLAFVYQETTARGEPSSFNRFIKRRGGSKRTGAKRTTKRAAAKRGGATKTATKRGTKRTATKRGATKRGATPGTKRTATKRTGATKSKRTGATKGKRTGATGSKRGGKTTRRTASSR